MSDDVEVKFGADTADAESHITQLREVLRGFSAPIQGIRENLGELAEAFVAAFAVEKVSEFFEKMAELGTQTSRTSAMLGITTEEVGRLNAISLATGTSAEGMSTTLERLALNLARAQQGTGPAAAALKALGLNAQDLIKLPLTGAMNEIAEKMSSFEDGTNKTAIAMSLLGRSGAQLIPVLNQGARGLEELGMIADRTGTAIGPATTERFEKLHQTITEAGLAFKGVGITIADAFTPAVTAIVGAISDLVEWFNTSIQAGGAFKGLLDLLAVAAKALATGLLTVVFAIEAVVQGTDLGLRVLRDVLTGNFSSVQTDFKTFQDSMFMSAQSFVARLNNLWGEAKTGGEGGEKKAAPTLNLGTDNSASIAAKEIEAEIKVLQLGLQEKKSLLDEELAAHKITNAQKFQSLQDWTDDTYDSEKELLQKELALYKQGSTEYAAVKAKLTELDAKYALDSQKITTDAVKAQTKTYTDFFNTIQGAFNSQLRGLLAGTTSWSQAFKNILGDLIIKFIEAVEKMGFEWVAGELAKTAATTTGVAARTSAEAAGATASLATTFASIMKSISASAAETFAGIFGFLSPVMGPAAAGPAVAGEASVAAVAASIPALDVGTSYVASDGLAMIHQGEAVVPAEVNGAWQGGGGANMSVTFAMQQIDTATGVQFLKNNMGSLARLLADHLRTNPSVKFT